MCVEVFHEQLERGGVGDVTEGHVALTPTQVTDGIQRGLHGSVGGAENGDDFFGLYLLRHSSGIRQRGCAINTHYTGASSFTRMEL